MNRRIVAVWICLMIVFSSIIILVEIAPSVEAPSTLYVGGAGPGNYSNIQWAIDNASSGNTVFVYSGTYYENVIVNKTINLTGEDKGTTIIDGLGNGDVVKVVSDWVNITGFSVQNSGATAFPDYDAGIELNNVQNCRIFGNKVTLNNRFGIVPYYSNDNNISYNTVTLNSNSGILLLYSHSNDIIKNDALSNSQGIRLEYSNSNNIISNNADSNVGVGIYFTYSDDNNITGNSASNNVDSYGFSIWRSHGNSFNHNTASNNEYGFYFYLCSNITFTNNNANLNNYIGVKIDYTHDNYIVNNTISDNIDGLFFGGSNRSIISNNTFLSNRDVSITLSGSSFNKLRNNTLSDSGIYFRGSAVESWTLHDIDTSNTVNGKPVYYCKNWTGGIVPSGAGEVILGNCTNTTVRDQVLINSGTAIVIGHSSYCNLINNTLMSNSKHGVRMWYSHHINFAENTLSDNYWGFFIDVSHDNYFINNTLSSTDRECIYIWHSDGNLISGNQLTSPSYSSIKLWYSDYNILINNMFSNSASCIYIDDSDDNYIIENTVINSLGGIGIDSSYDNVVTENTLVSCSGRAIYLTSSSWNHIIKNYIFDGTDYAISITGLSSSNNKIYHNNIINNTNQARDINDDNQWHNGYPGGGNYWSDYSGVDNYKGPGQNIAGRDGIGDSAYVIDADSQDNYPLMEPIENYTILKKGWNLISTPLIQENQNLPIVLDMIDGYYNAVQWFDESDTEDPWKHYKVGKPSGNDLFTLNETKGFWIYVIPENGAVLLHNGTHPVSNQTIQLYTGWNMVGYPSLSIHNRTVGLNNLAFGTDVDCIQWYDASDKTWHTMGPDDYFIPGRGYWVHSNVEATWEVPL
jgi:parallel beta-helix repeat protein